MKKIFCLLTLCFLFHQNSLAQSIKPGIWKGKVSFNMAGIELPPSEDEDCILPHEAKDVKTSIEKNLKKKGCSITKWTIKSKRLDASVVCKSTELDATGSLGGQFSDTSYKLEGKVAGTYQEMLPATAALKLEGDWVKACPK